MIRPRAVIPSGARDLTQTQAISFGRGGDLGMTPSRIGLAYVMTVTQ